VVAETAYLIDRQLGPHAEAALYESVAAEAFLEVRGERREVRRG
jgi:hypothetical protein